MKRILYISLDGLLDPLGSSQILPYINGSSKSDLIFFICTIENKNKINKIKNLKKIIEKNKNLHWEYYLFKKKRGKINRLLELILLYTLTIKTFLLKQIDILHSRSYLPMFVCIFLKLFSKVKIIFDTRGSWFDERIEGGMLKQNGIDLVIYKILKSIEFLLFKSSDYIIFLTNNGLNKVNKSFIKDKKISIIPCAADYSLFKILDVEKKNKIKKSLGLEEKFIITYSGSLGSWYNFDQIKIFYSNFLSKYPDTFLIILTQSEIQKELSNLPDHIKNKIIFLSTKREFIPEIIGVSDLTLCFIKKTPSKIFSSPTKVGESLGCGVPIVYNEGIGDLDDDLESMKLGCRLNQNRFVNETDLEQIILSGKSKLQIRENSIKKYGLENAVKKFVEIYKSI